MVCYYKFNSCSVKFTSGGDSLIAAVVQTLFTLVPDWLCIQRYIKHNQFYINAIHWSIKLRSNRYKNLEVAFKKEIHVTTIKRLDEIF